MHVDKSAEYSLTRTRRSAQIPRRSGRGPLPAAQPTRWNPRIWRYLNHRRESPLVGTSARSSRLRTMPENLRLHEARRFHCREGEPSWQFHRTVVRCHRVRRHWHVENTGCHRVEWNRCPSSMVRGRVPAHPQREGALGGAVDRRGRLRSARDDIGIANVDGGRRSTSMAPASHAVDRGPWPQAGPANDIIYGTASQSPGSNAFRVSLICSAALRRSIASSLLSFRARI